MSQPRDRRTFLKTTSALISTGVLGSQAARNAHAAGSDEIRFCVVGCGGRGTGAAAQIFNTKGNTRLVSVADAFEKNAKSAVKRLTRHSADKVSVPEENIHWGLNAYKKAIDSDCDLVVIATPPGFKPQQFQYAVDRGKHVFMEKPVATDAPGIKRVLESVEASKQKNLMVALGLQRRHEPRYMETIERIHDGAIGDVICQRVYWNGGGIWYRNRQPGQSEMEFQVNNWYHFNWVCGDQICEQHIHNLDVANWVKGDYPVECNGMGGGEQRLGGDRSKSQIYDHTFCEFTYPDGSKLFSQGRHVAGAWSHVGEAVHGTKGTANPAGSIDGSWQFSGPYPNGHQQEQHDMIEALMAGNIYNEGEYGAKSTFTSILGREACYSGQIIRWDELLEKGRDLAPGIDQFTMQSPAPTARDASGEYEVPVPGQYNPFA
ncbi:MAG: Gfo/Idh/MocA family oxidoreductase [Pirellulales bacterium]|nr:Gfo/Idh/MocA family oxidoreductase [Pirellulales bacterium]